MKKRLELMRSRTLSEGRKDGLPEAHSQEQPLSTQGNPMRGRNNVSGGNSALPSIQLSTKGKMSGPRNSSGLTIIRKIGHNIDYTSLRETTYGQILVGDTSELDKVRTSFKWRVFWREFLLHFFNPISAPIAMFLFPAALLKMKRLIPSFPCGSFLNVIETSGPYFIWVCYIFAIFRGYSESLWRSNLLLALAAVQYNARILLISLKYAMSKKLILNTILNEPSSAKAATYFQHLNIVTWLRPTSEFLDFHVASIAIEKGIDTSDSGNVVSRFATKEEALAMKQDILHCITGGGSVVKVDGIFEIRYLKDENCHELKVNSTKLITLIVLSESSHKKSLISYFTFLLGQVMWISALVLLYFGSTKCSEWVVNEVNGTNTTVGGITRVTCMATMAETPENLADLVLDSIFVAICSIFGFFYSNVVFIIFDTIVQDSSRRYRMLRRFDSLFAERVEVLTTGDKGSLPNIRSMKPIIVLDKAEKIRAFETMRALLKSLGKPQRFRGNVLIAYSMVINIILFMFAIIAFAIKTLPNEGFMRTINTISFFQTFAAIFGDRIILSLVAMMTILIGKTLVALIANGARTNEQVTFARKMLLDQRGMLLTHPNAYAPKEQVATAAELLISACDKLRLESELRPVTVIGLRADFGLIRIFGSAFSVAASVIAGVLSQVLAEK